MTVISYPIPPYQNVPIQAQNYQPSQFFIENISLGRVTTITTTTDLNYVIGQEIRLLIPPTFGSIQLNGRTGFVINVLADDQVVVDIDSSINVDAYIASNATTQAQILAIGDCNLGQINSNGPHVTTYVPGSFINISPE